MTRREDNSDMAARQARVILGATCYCDAEAALTIATELARHTGAELHGVLVRDEAILSITNRPFAGIVSYSGVQATEVTTDAMFRAFQADARRFEHQLLRRAKAAALQSAFREIKGRLPEAMRKTAGSGDFIIVGFKRAVRDSNDIVLVIGEGTTVPEFAEALAKKFRKRLVVLRPKDLKSDQQIENQPRDSPDGLLTRLDQMSPAAVVLAEPISGLPSLMRIVDAARCPVILSLTQGT